MRTLIAVGFGLLAALLVLEINESPFLPAPHADSISYMSAAESLAGDTTLRLPYNDWGPPDSTSVLAHFPPGFSFAMAVPVALGATGVGAALIVLALSAGVTVTLAFLLVQWASGTLAGATVAVLLIATPSLVIIHTGVWSEPLFLALMLATLHVMIRRPYRPFSYGMLAAAATLVRYVGLALLVPVALWAFGRHGTWAERLERVAAAVGPTVIAFVVWLVFTDWQGGRVRSLGFYSDFGRSLRSLPGALSEWLMPVNLGGVGVVVGVAAFITVAVTILFGYRSEQLEAMWLESDDEGEEAETPRVPPAERAERTQRLLEAFGIVVVSYIAAVLGARLLADPLIPFDTRMFAPVIVLVELAFVVGLTALWPGMSRVWRTGLVATLALWAVAGLLNIHSGVRTIKESGRLYTAAVWRGSRALEWVRAEGAEYRLYSNEPEMLYFHTGRSSRRLPSFRTAGDPANFIRAYQIRPGAVVVMPPLRPGELPPSVLIEMLGLETVMVEGDGVVLIPRRGGG